MSMKNKLALSFFILGTVLLIISTYLFSSKILELQEEIDDKNVAIMEMVFHQNQYIQLKTDILVAQGLANIFRENQPFLAEEYDNIVFDREIQALTSYYVATQDELPSYYLVDNWRSMEPRDLLLVEEILKNSDILNDKIDSRRDVLDYQKYLRIWAIMLQIFGIIFTALSQIMFFQNKNI